MRLFPSAQQTGEVPHLWWGCNSGTLPSRQVLLTVNVGFCVRAGTCGCGLCVVAYSAPVKGQRQDGETTTKVATPITKVAARVSLSTGGRVV